MRIRTIGNEPAGPTLRGGRAQIVAVTPEDYNRMPVSETPGDAPDVRIPPPVLRRVEYADRGAATVVKDSRVLTLIVVSGFSVH